MSTDLRTRLHQSLGSRFVLGDELGGGGMARVFAATESALDRKVVIKVLSPELAEGVSHQRFAREVKLIASLQQANIVPILATGEIEEADGEPSLPYYTMPFVEGRSLHDRLARDGALGIPESIGILRDVARALAYAHEHGVVHRDIKPGNVLLSGDTAVVTDFGIARAISAARGTSVETRPATTLTQAGVSVGTPAYMAPEQVIADPNVDHRADLYAFGCLAYELLTGATPFADGSVQQVLAAHVSQTPPPLGARNPACPPVVVRVVMQCLEKSPADRPESAREILRALESDVSAASGFSKLRNRLSHRQRTIAAVAAAAVVIAIAAAVIVKGGRAGAVSSVAVVPFFNADSTLEYLTDGIAEELATSLGKLPGIRVKSRNASRQFRNRRDADARAIGSTLGASHVLQGTLTVSNGRMHIRAALTAARDNEEVWSNSFDRSSSDVLGMEEEIARDLIRKLRGNASVAIATDRGTSNEEAYDLYVRGRHQLQRRSSGVRQAVNLFHDAIAKDSNYARTYASYALAVELIPYFESADADSLGKIAIPAAQRALALDSTLADAYTALAMAYQHRYDWQHAEEQYRRAIAVGPDELDAQIQYARFLFYTGRIAEALPRFRRARELDPNSAVASGWVGHLLELSGQRDSAFRELHRALENDSTNPPSLWFMGQAQLRAGHRDSARMYAQRLIAAYPAWKGPGVGILVQAGDTELGRAFIRTRSGPQLSAWGIFAALGDSTRLFEALEQATAAHDTWPTQASLSEPYMDFVRGSKRFAAIVRAVGLDEKIFTSPTGGRPVK